MRAIGGQGGDELACAALGVPRAVGVGPGAASLRGLVVGDGVGHAAVEQPALDLVAAPAAAGVGRRPVDAERAVLDGDLGSQTLETDGRAVAPALRGAEIGPALGELPDDLARAEVEA